MDKQLHPSDAELVEAACSGDVDSYRCLYEKHYRLAVGLAYSRLRDIHLAEDAAQEAFAFACRKLHTLRKAERFPEWLGTICRRIASKISVRQGHSAPIRDEPSCEYATEENDDVAVRDAMNRLPLAARELLTLHYFSGLSYEQIALSLGISSQAVHGRLQRARKKLAYYLSLDMKKRTAMLKKEPSGQFGPGGPFESIGSLLRDESIEFVGQQTVDGKLTNVFRHHREFKNGSGESIEIWIDAKSKHLVQFCTTPGKVYFDPKTAPDRDAVAEEKFSKGTIAGSITRDIVLDAQLDPSLFSLTPPSGFEIVNPPPRVVVTEVQLLEWLRLSAEANGGTFLKLERGFNMQWHNAIANKSNADRTEAERNYMKVAYQHIVDGNWVPLKEFYETLTEPKSFRYLGQGVKLGDKDRLVCFYKLKGTDHYRAVYGDLSVKDVSAQDLPLPVE